jgi:hypothetical protein
MQKHQFVLAFQGEDQLPYIKCIQSDAGDWYRVTHVDARIAELEKDAERYRYLRDLAGNDILRLLMREARPDKWDALVDEDRADNTAD